MTHIAQPGRSPTIDRASALDSKKPIPLSIVYRRLDLLQWLVPGLMVLMVIIYEVGAAQWIHQRWGNEPHVMAEIAFFGFLGPALAFTLIFFFRRFLEEKETSELQTQLLSQVREQVKDNQIATDDALQAIFPASVFLATLESKCSGFSEEELQVMRQTQQAFDQSIQNLRRSLNADIF